MRVRVFVSVYQCVFSPINISWANILCYKAACLIQLFVIEIGEEWRKEESNKNWRTNERVKMMQRARCEQQKTKETMNNGNNRYFFSVYFLSQSSKLNL